MGGVVDMAHFTEKTVELDHAVGCVGDYHYSTMTTRKCCCRRATGSCSLTMRCACWSLNFNYDIYAMGYICLGIPVVTKDSAEVSQ